MLRKVIYVVSLILLALVVTLFYQRLNDKPVTQSNNKIFQAIPSDAAIIVSSDQILTLTGELQNQNLVWKSLIKTELLGHISNQLTDLDSLLNSRSELKAGINETQVAISFQLAGRSSIEPLFVVTLNHKIPGNRLKNFIIDNSAGEISVKQYNNISITYIHDSTNVSGFFIYQDLLIWAKSELVLERSARELTSKVGLTLHEGFNKLRKTQRSNVLATLFINTDALKGILEPYSNGKYLTTLAELAGNESWFGVDVALESNSVSLMGFYTVDNSNYLSSFEGQSPKTLDLLNVVPVGAQQFNSINIQDIKLFRSNYKRYLEAHNKKDDYEAWIDKTTDQLGQNPELFADDFFGGEFLKVTYGGISNNKAITYIMANIKSKSLAEDALKARLKIYAGIKKVDVDQYTDKVRIDKDLSVTCYTVEFSGILGILYGNLLKSDQLSYWAFYDNYLIAAPDKKILKDIIYNNELGKTLSRQSYFEEFYANMTNEYNVLFYQDCRSVPFTSEENWKDPLYANFLGNDDAFSNLNGIGFQMVAYDKYPYVNFITDYSGQQKTDAETIWQSLLDTTFVMKPALVKNHYTGENEIFLQDLGNTVYLISPSGRIIWKKVLNEPILSDVYQVDAYKNGKLQLLFNTPTKLYLLDRNGNYVDRFPVNLPSEATTGLGLADYGNNRNYRIFIPVKNKRIMLYAVDGNRVKGWKFNKTDHVVTHPVQHIRFDSKDYILVADKNRVYILDRQGRSRVNLSEQFSKNDNVDFYPLYTGPGGSHAVLTGDTDGNLVTVLLSGAVNKRKLPLQTDTYQMVIENIDGTGGVEVITVENQSMKVFDYRGNLLFERIFPNIIENKPNIYQFSGRDFKIGVVDRKQQNIYLFNNDGTVKAGFPLHGITPFSIGFLKSSSGSFNLIVGGRDHYLYNYIVK